MSNNKDTQEQNKFLQENQMTYFQQIALQGEVASIISTCATENEKVCYAFTQLALCEERYVLVYKNEFTKYIDASIVNDLVSFRYSEIIPTYVYVEKYATELKAMLGEDCGALRVAKQPVEVVKSKFVAGMRELMRYIPNTASAIIDGMIAKYGDELEFLHTLAFALKQDKAFAPIEQTIPFEGKVKMLAISFTQTPILSLMAEERQVLEMANMNGKSSDERAKEAVNVLAGISNALKDLIFLGESEEEQKPEKMVYVVKKIDKINNKVVSTKEFDTQKQATEYIKTVVSDYPELAKRFNFAVEMMEVYNN